MEDFAEMARSASTPFNGKTFLPDEDENTCAVDLIFKKPVLPAVVQVKRQEEAPLSPIMETSRYSKNYFLKGDELKTASIS
jgi:hypothetical protein